VTLVSVRAFVRIREIRQLIETPKPKIKKRTTGFAISYEMKKTPRLTPKHSVIHLPPGKTKPLANNQ